MFLATTALTEFWKDDEDLLFLGVWCLRYDRRLDWEHRKFQVLPCLWNDRERFYRAAQYLDEYGERLLRNLADYLNAVHGLSKSHRYWRILVGPWLFHYLHALYDRHAHLVEAFRRYPQLETILLAPDSYQVPRDTFESVEALTEDRFNLQLCSQVLQELGHVFPIKSAPDGLWATDKRYERRERRRVKRLMHQGLRRLSEMLNRYCAEGRYAELGDLYCPQADILKLMWRTRFGAIPRDRSEEWNPPNPAPMFNESRCGLRSIPTTNEFESLVVRSCVYTFPTLFLEGFAEGREPVRQMARSRPAVIVSASDWLFNEPFKFEAAEASEQGTRLVAVQHGGGYGTYVFSPAELHERRLSDSFMAWGWAADDPGGDKNLPSPRLSHLATSCRTPSGAGSGDTILFVSTNHPRYLYRFHSMPVSSQMDDYFTWELRFLGALSEQMRASVVFRPYALDYGQSVRERISDRYPDVRWDNGQTFGQQLQDARLVVFDHRGTGCLETLAADVPTILFWDPLHWETRQEAEPYFNRLRKVGILWDSPEGAATKACEVFENPSLWWESEPVQETRRDFTERYALSRGNWAECWAQALEQEAAMGAGGSAVPGWKR